MCDICKDVLSDFGIEHTIQNCPLRTSRYCSYCASYGHLTKSCPAKPSQMYREPVYLEQLIPPSMLKEYNITTTTPINIKLSEPKQQLLEIDDNDKVISTYLSSRGIKITRKAKENRLILEEYAKSQNKRLVYLTQK